MGRSISSDIFLKSGITLACFLSVTMVAKSQAGAVTKLTPETFTNENTLEKNIAITDLAGEYDDEKHFTFEVPENVHNLSIRIIEGHNDLGDADLYVRYGETATQQEKDCAPLIEGSSEECFFSTAQPGTYHIMLHAYDPYENLTLLATYSDPLAQEDEDALEEEAVEPVTILFDDISGKKFSSKHFSFEVPQDTTRLTVKTKGPNGNANLYVRQGPYTASYFFYDCKVEDKTTSNGTCTFNYPIEGEWRVSISTRTKTYSDLSLEITFE